MLYLDNMFFERGFVVNTRPNFVERDLIGIEAV